MKKYLIMLVTSIILITSTFAGCTNVDKPSGTSGSTTSSDEKEDITLRFSWWGQQARNEITTKAIDLYKAQNPYIDFETEFLGWDGYWEKMSAQVAANNLPDIFQMSTLYMEQYKGKALLEELTQYSGDKTLDLTNIDEGILASVTYDGKIHGLPLGVNCLAVIADTQLIKESGLELPSPDWTWDKYEEMTATIHKKLGIYGSNHPDPEIVFLEYYVREFGQELYSDDGKSLGYDNDQILIDFFNRILKSLDAGVIPPLDEFFAQKTIENSFMVRQIAPIEFNFSNLASAYQTAAKRDMDLLIFPSAGPEDIYGTSINPAMLGAIFSRSKHKVEAVKFLSYFLNDIEANKAMMADRGVPISSKVRESLKPLLSPMNAKIFDFIELAAKYSRPVNPMPAKAAEVKQAYMDIYERVCYKQMTPEEAAAKFREQANKILASE